MQLRNLEEKIVGLKKILDKYSKDTIIIATHRNADIDGVASIIALREIVENATNGKANVRLLVPEKPNLISRNILSRLNIKLEIEENISSYNSSRLLLIVADISNSSQLGPCAQITSYAGEIVLVDHHSIGDLDEKASIVFKYTEVSSTSEIVYLISRALGYRLSKSMLKALLAGIIFDTRHLLLAKPLTFKIIADILSEGIEYREVVSIMRLEPNISEKIARIKATLRARYYRLNDIIIAVTRVGAHESSAARIMQEIGADIVYIIGDHDEEVRVIARASHVITEKLRIHLVNDILSRLKDYFKGSGGGHPGAGGYTIKEKVDLDRLASILLEITVNTLKLRGLSGKLVEVKE